jgi:hypothetical protein
VCAGNKAPEKRERPADSEYESTDKSQRLRSAQKLKAPTHKEILNTNGQTSLRGSEAQILVNTPEPVDKSKKNNLARSGFARNLIQRRITDSYSVRW